MLEYYPIKNFINEPDHVRVECLRANILYMITRAGSGHLGSAMSALEITYGILVNNPGTIFISSKGHDCAAQYAILMMQGVIPEEEIHRFRTAEGLPGHPHPSTPGIVTHTGSLGMGLSKAQGIALANRLQGKKVPIVVLCGDGEMQEGQNFEAWRNIRNRGMDEIRAIVDGNGFQCDRSLYQTTGPFHVGLPGWQSQYLRTTKSFGLPWAGTNKYHGGRVTDEDYQAALAMIKRKIPAHVATEPEPPRPKSHDRRPKANTLRGPYSEVLFNAMMADERMVCLDADLARDCGIERIRDIFPDRFFEFGISEQDMVSAAGGMALRGLIPVVNTFAAFFRRAYEQIYNNACEGTKIIYVGHLAGRLPPGPGPSHEAVEDGEFMALIPGMRDQRVNDPGEIERAFQFSFQYDGPSYISIPCIAKRRG
jgi:transketolase